MRIRSLTMKDFRGFADATVDLDRPLTVLCGVNGSGKSSVLMACAIVLSHVLLEVRRFDTRTETPLLWFLGANDTDVRHGALKLSLKATMCNGGHTDEVGMHHPDPLRLASGLDRRLLELNNAAPALSVSYDSSRAVPSAKDAFHLQESGSDTPTEHPYSATGAALVASHLKFRSLFQWFKTREDAENELKVAQQDLSLQDSQLAAVRRAVTAMLPGFSGLRIQRDPLHMLIHKGEETLVVDQLSDGEKLLLALTADLARRLAITYTDLADPLQGEAVVLIDEIELHLHPDWQRRVLTDLRRTFPNCQFIVTTHSPQVLSEVPNDAVILVKDFQFFRPPAPTEGRDTNAILWEVLGVPARPKPIVERLDAIAGLLDDGKPEEARHELDRLAQALTERDPEVARLRGLLDVVERLDASDHEGA